jgi:ABC-2 type transport system ATP-binding protein
MYARMKVRDHLVYYAKLSGRRGVAAGQAADEWLERLGLSERAQDTVQSLSSGNQQRVQVALAILNDPSLLVLDEPFSGLDPVAVEVLGQVLREQVARGAALLLSSHQLDLVAGICSAVVIVDRGRVVLRGDVARLRASSATRHVDVEFAAPTTWSPPGEVTVSDDRRRYRITVAVGTDADPMIAEARRCGEVVGYSFAPPTLSDVFLSAVGRDALEDPAHAAMAETG